MEKNKDSLLTPICLVEGDFSALLCMENMRDKGIPVFYNVQNQILYTNNEENASKARYLLFSCA